MDSPLQRALKALKEIDDYLEINHDKAWDVMQEILEANKIYPHATYRDNEED